MTIIVVDLAKDPSPRRIFSKIHYSKLGCSWITPLGCMLLLTHVMFHQHSSAIRSRRTGFTLMELLLVLAILVVVGAIMIPVAMGPLENQKLQKSADLMRAAWNKARVNSMRTGLIHVFQYQPETGNYMIKPWMADQDSTESNPLETPLGDTAGSTAYQAYAQQKELPDQIIFVQGSAETDIRWQMHVAEESDQNATAGQLSPPIVFYPDGTTSNAQIWLSTEERKYFVSVQMRGMTGISRAGPLLSAEEMP